MTANPEKHMPETKTDSRERMSSRPERAVQSIDVGKDVNPVGRVRASYRGSAFAGERRE
jgi:hypothetical protein